jgi:hypothetical protein
MYILTCCKSITLEYFKSNLKSIILEDIDNQETIYIFKRAMLIKIDMHSTANVNTNMLFKLEIGNDAYDLRNKLVETNVRDIYVTHIGINANDYNTVDTSAYKFAME